MLDSEENQKPTYDQILHKTLLERTGRNFKRNIERAPIPQSPPSLNQEEAINLIFDNILKKQKKQAADENAPQPPFSQSLSSSEVSHFSHTAATQNTAQSIHISQTYSNILDSILGLEDSSHPEQNKESGHSLQNTAAAAKEKFHKTKTDTASAALTSWQSKSHPLISQTFASALDSILELDEVSHTSAQSASEPHISETELLTQTLYHQQLDEILWPSEAKKKSNRTRYTPC